MITAMHNAVAGFSIGFMSLNDYHSIKKAAGATAAVAALAASLVACSSDDAKDAAADATSAAASAADKATDAASSAASEAKDAITGAGDGLKVFATTGYIGDAVHNIAPAADVQVLVGPGGDPHTYQPSSKDLQDMNNADVVLWSGVHLESEMEKQLEGLGDKQEAVGEAIPKDKLLDWPEPGDNGEKLYDPHIWNDTDNWELVVTAIADRLAKAQPEDADAFKENAEKYNSEISDAKKYVQDKINTIPESERDLITGHDAFNYFGREFGLKVTATDFITTESQKSAAEINDIAQQIVDDKIKMIFPDNVANPQGSKSLQEIAQQKGWDVKISDKELYADTLGESAPTNTYIGVLKHNADVIADGLGAN